MSVGLRVRQHVATAQPLIDGLTGTSREAARLLFSALAHLEGVAVLAAERGDAVAGQLEDEHVHQQAFRAIALGLGGLAPAPDAVGELLRFLEGLRGRASLAVLNVTAEAWLERCLGALARAGVCEGLFAAIEADEARHAALARESPKPDPEAAEPLLRALERLLARVTQEPGFILPLMHFLGVQGASRAASEIVQSHREACAHLGVAPGPVVADMRRIFREASRIPDPVAVEMRDWDHTRLEAFGDRPGEMHARIDVVWSDGPKSIELAVIRAAGAALAERPWLGRVASQGLLYECREVVVGARRLTKEGEVFTVYARRPQVRTPGSLRGELAEHAEIGRRHYCSSRGFRAWSWLAPPSRCPVVVTNVAVFGEVHGGWVPLVPGEGVTTAITWTSLRRRRWPKRPTFTLCLTMDHRVMDGRQIVEMAEAMKRHLEGPGSGRRRRRTAGSSASSGGRTSPRSTGRGAPSSLPTPTSTSS